MWDRLAQLFHQPPPADTGPIPWPLISSVLPLILDWVRLLCCHKQNLVVFLFFFWSNHILLRDYLTRCSSFYHLLVLTEVVLQSTIVPQEGEDFLLSNKNKSCLQNQGGAINTRDVKCDQIVGKRRCSLLNEWRRIITITFISSKTKPRVRYLVQGISLSITVNFAGKALQKFSTGSASQQRPRPTPSSPHVRGSAVISPAVMISDKSSQQSRELFAHSTLGLGMHNSVCGSSPPAAGNDQPSWLDSCRARTVACRAEQSWPDAGSVPSIQSWEHNYRFQFSFLQKRPHTWCPICSALSWLITGGARLIKFAHVK